MIRVAAVVTALVAGVAAAAPSCPQAACPQPPCPQAACPPRQSGPVAAAHTRTWRHGRATCRVTRRTPEVMLEDAARVPRGEIFRTWESAARQ